MIEKIYPYRFEIFFFSQITILFGSLIAPGRVFENLLSPLLFQVNLLSGILLLYKKKRLMWFLAGLLITAGAAMVGGSSNGNPPNFFDFIRLGTLFTFYNIVTIEIIKQVWRSEYINKNVILGLVSGYISIGLIGFFTCLSIELGHQNSFSNLYIADTLVNGVTDRLMYFSYITLMTIGYGDIYPLTAIAQKATMFISLAGQFYLVIITAIVVGKYINQKSMQTPDKKG